MGAESFSGLETLAGWLTSALSFSLSALSLESLAGGDALTTLLTAVSSLFTGDVFSPILGAGLGGVGTMIAASLQSRRVSDERWLITRTWPRRLQETQGRLLELVTGFLDGGRRPQDVKVVDVGLGMATADGSPFTELADELHTLHPEIQVIGVDIQPEVVKMAVEHLGDRPQVDVLLADAFQPSDRLAGADVIRVANLFGYEQDGAVREQLTQLSRHLRKGGWLMVVTANAQQGADEFGDYALYQKTPEGELIAKEYGFSVNNLRTDPFGRLFPQIDTHIVGVDARRIYRSAWGMTARNGEDVSAVRDRVQKYLEQNGFATQKLPGRSYLAVALHLDGTPVRVEGRWPRIDRWLRAHGFSLFVPMLIVTSLLAATLFMQTTAVGIVAPSVAATMSRQGGVDPDANPRLTRRTIRDLPPLGIHGLPVENLPGLRRLPRFQGTGVMIGTDAKQLRVPEFRERLREEVIKVAALTPLQRVMAHIERLEGEELGALPVLLVVRSMDQRSWTWTGVFFDERTRRDKLLGQVRLTRQDYRLLQARWRRSDVAASIQQGREVLAEMAKEYWWTEHIIDLLLSKTIRQLNRIAEQERRGSGEGRRGGRALGMATAPLDLSTAATGLSEAAALSVAGWFQGWGHVIFLGQMMIVAVLLAHAMTFAVRQWGPQPAREEPLRRFPRSLAIVMSVFLVLSGLLYIGLSLVGDVWAPLLEPDAQGVWSWLGFGGAGAFLAATTSRGRGRPRWITPENFALVRQWVEGGRSDEDIRRLGAQLGLTAEQVDRLRQLDALLHEGLSESQIARRLGMTRANISLVLQRIGTQYQLLSVSARAGRSAVMTLRVTGDRVIGQRVVTITPDWQSVTVTGFSKGHARQVGPEHRRFINLEADEQIDGLWRSDPLLGRQMVERLGPAWGERLLAEIDTYRRAVPLLRYDQEYLDGALTREGILWRLSRVQPAVLAPLAENIAQLQREAPGIIEEARSPAAQNLLGAMPADLRQVVQRVLPPDVSVEEVLLAIRRIRPPTLPEEAPAPTAPMDEAARSLEGLLSIAETLADRDQPRQRPEAPDIAVDLNKVLTRALLRELQRAHESLRTPSPAGGRLGWLLWPLSWFEEHKLHAWMLRKLGAPVSEQDIHVSAEASYVQLDPTWVARYGQTWRMALGAGIAPAFWLSPGLLTGVGLYVLGSTTSLPEMVRVSLMGLLGLVGVPLWLMSVLHVIHPIRAPTADLRWVGVALWSMLEPSIDAAFFALFGRPIPLWLVQKPLVHLPAHQRRLHSPATSEPPRQPRQTLSDLKTRIDRFLEDKPLREMADLEEATQLLGELLERTETFGLTDMALAEARLAQLIGFIENTFSELTGRFFERRDMFVTLEHVFLPGEAHAVLSPMLETYGRLLAVYHEWLKIESQMREQLQRSAIALPRVEDALKMANVLMKPSGDHLSGVRGPIAQMRQDTLERQ